MASLKNYFISYNRADRQWAEWIAWQLEAGGWSTVIQAWDFVPGSDFVEEMDRASRVAERTVAVLSPDYLSAIFTSAEWHVAFAEDPLGEFRKLVPIKVRPCEPEGLLKTRVYVDFVGLGEDEARDKLLAMARGTRLKPACPPKFPGESHASTSIGPRFPGSLPALCNLGLHRNPFFSGRDRALETIRQTLVSKSTGIPIRVITGLGGVGKTQIALEYIYRNACEYDLVWWIPAHDYPSMIAEYAGLATALDLSEKSVRSFPEISRSVRRWLEAHGGWLLVFDDAQDWSQIQSLVPIGASGHTIITSRNQVWQHVPRPIRTTRWERVESVGFLVKRLEKVKPESANNISEVLGDLPLALEHAAAYIQSKGISLLEYLDLFRSHQLKLFGHIQPPENYGKTILTTWDLSFQSAAKASIEAAVILQVASFFSSEEIPKSFFTAGPEEVGPLIPPLAFHDAVEILRRYSLIDVTDTGISIHPLVQAVVREALRDRGQVLLEAGMLRLLTAFPQGDDPAHWNQCAKLLPHILAAGSHAQSMKCDLELVGRVFHSACIYLQSRGLLREAKLLTDRVVVLAQEVYGVDHPNVASALNNRGVLSKELGDHQSAEADYQQALQILETAFGWNDPAVAQILNHQAILLLEQQRYEIALAKVRRALEIDKAAFGRRHEALARDMMTLGGILEKLGKVHEALQMQTLALAIYKQAFGEEDLRTLTARSNLGRVLEDIGHLAAARRHHEKTLSVGEKLLGPEHINVATYLSNLASVLDRLKNPKAAIPLYERALAIEELAFGPKHPTVAICMANLAHALRDTGDIQGAKDRLTRAKAILTDFYGPDHPHVAVVTSNLESLADR